MSYPGSFKAIQLTRFGDKEKTIADNTELILDKPLCRPLARLCHDVLFEQSCTAVEWYTVPGRQQLSQYVTVEPPESGGDREEYLRPFGHDAARELPPSVSVVLTTVDLAPLGTTPAPTHRLLTTREDLASWDGGSVESGASPLRRFIVENLTRAEPSILKVSVRKILGSGLEVSVWWIDYAPTARYWTREEFTQYQMAADWPSLAAPFGGKPLTTTFELPTQYGCEYTSPATGGHTATPLYELPSDEGAAAAAELAITLARKPQEYLNSTTVNRDDEPLQNTYQKLDIDPWLTINSEQLPRFCGLPAVFYPQSAWRHAPGRLEPFVETHESFRELRTHSENTNTIAATLPPPTTKWGSESPAVAQSRELCGTAADSTATATDSTDQSPDPFVQTTAIRLLERGDDLESISTGPPELRFKATTPDGTTSSVLVGDESLTPTSVVAAAAVTHRTPEIDALTIVTENSDTASQVSTWLQEPYDYRTADGGVRLYRSSKPISNETHQAVHPPSAGPEEWYVFPDGTVYCIHDDEICVSFPLSNLPSQPLSDAALSTALLDELPPKYQTSIEDADKTPTADASETQPIQPEEVYAIRTPVWLPHVASGLRDTTILVNTEGFVEHRPTPTWEHQEAATEEQQAAAAFINQYLTHAHGQTVALEDAVSLFSTWYYAHEGTTPLSDPTAAFKQGYNMVYDHSLEESASTVPDCRWLYPPD